MARVACCLAFLALAAVFASVAAQDQDVAAPAADAEQSQGGSWFDFVFQITVDDNNSLETWTFSTDESGNLAIDMEMPDDGDLWAQNAVEDEDAAPPAEPASLAMAAPKDDDDSTNCAMFLQTAFNVCEEQRCDFRHHCHHHRGEEEDQQGEAEADEEDGVSDMDDKEGRGIRGRPPPPPGPPPPGGPPPPPGPPPPRGPHGPRISRQCRDAVQDARDKMDQCADKMFQSTSDPGFAFNYDDALTALEEANEEACQCGFFCRHPMILLLTSTFFVVLLWSTIYVKMLRCMVLRHRERRGRCKSALLAVLLLPLSFIVLSLFCVVMSAMLAFPMLAFALLASLGMVLLARRYRLRRQRRCRRLAEARTVNLPTVPVSAPAAGRTVPTATLVAFPAGRAAKSDVVVTAIVV